MTSPQTLYVAPATRGTGDGTSPANAHAMYTDADAAWLINKMSVWRTELDANPNDVGLNHAHTINTVKPGLEPNYGDKSYITDVRYGIYVRRVCFLTDFGPYEMTGTGSINPKEAGSWINIPETAGPAIPAEGTGLTAQNPIKRFHIVGYRASDGKRSDEVAGGTITRSVTVPRKTAASDWTSGANYTSTSPRVWSGPTENATRTFTVNSPSPIRAVINGNRTKDPRTGNKHVQQWCVTNNTNPQQLRDPHVEAQDPHLVKSDGVTTVFLNSGEWYDPATETIHPLVGIFHLGSHAFGMKGSCTTIQGFEVNNVGSLATFANSDPARWQSILDIHVNNARYLQWRGDYHYDVEISRCHLLSVAQKHIAPGVNCQRWHMSHLYADGNLCVGDRIQSLMGASNGSTGQESAYNAGAFRFENVIVEWMWDAGQADQKYTQGDGIDCESKGWTVRNYYCDLTGDGAIDTKPSPYWTNWPAFAMFNAYVTRNKRAIRSWGSIQLPGSVAPHILRDVTIADAREYGLFMVGSPNGHKYVNWHNPGGWANFLNPTGRNFPAVSNDNSLGGDMDAVIHQAFDARTGTKQWTFGFNTRSARGFEAGPWRARVWTPLTAPTTFQVKVNGQLVDDGQIITRLPGETVTLEPVSVPTGTVVNYKVNGAAEIEKTGNNATITVIV